MNKKVRESKYLVWDVQRGNWIEIYGEDYQSAYRMLGDVVDPDYKEIRVPNLRGIRVWCENDRNSERVPISMIQEDKNGKIRKQLRGNLLFSKSGKEFITPLSNKDIDNIKNQSQFYLIYDENLTRFTMALRVSAA